MGMKSHAGIEVLLGQLKVLCAAWRSSAWLWLVEVASVSMALFSAAYLQSL